MEEHWRKVREIFEAALERPAVERAAFLDTVCAGDLRLREEVEQLLRDDKAAEAEEFLDDPGSEVRALRGVVESGDDTSPGHGGGGSSPTDPERIGPYRILEKIGEGGMAVVYLAEQVTPFHRRVALKMIKPGLDSKEVLARFESERQALAILNHPNIAKIFDANVSEQGRAYFVMEYVAGVLLNQYCDKHRLSIRERLDIFVQVCQAIHHAHQKGVIHRDIKPSNIMVTVQDGKPVAKVIDFGVAKALDQRLTERTLFTERGVIIGTPEYMSPEQAEMSGLDVDTTTDVYSLGVILYELLVGVLPFEPRALREAGYAEMQRLIREVEPPRLTTRFSTLGEKTKSIAEQRRVDPEKLRKQIRNDLEWIVLRAMEKDRTRRYPSASELAADISRHLQGEPVAAGPPGAGYRLRKFVRRNRRLVAAVGGIVGALALGLAVSIAMYARSERAREAALYRSYLAYLSAADAALERGYVEQARASLENCPAEYRGWEWSHLRLRSDCSLRKFGGLEVDVQDAAISPENNLVALACRDSTIRLWDIGLEREVRVLRGHAGTVSAVAFSPDGDLLASGAFDETVKLWQPLEGELVATLRGHTYGIKSLSFSRSGDRLAATQTSALLPDTTDVIVWEIPSGRILRRLSCNQFSPAALSPDGQRVAAVLDDGMREFDVGSGAQVRDLGRMIPWGASIEYSPDGRSLLGCSARVLRTWNLLAGEPNTLPYAPVGEIWQATYNTDGNWILGGAERVLFVLDAMDGRTLHGPFVGHEHEIISAAFFPAANHLVTVSSDGTIRVWDPSIDGRPLQPYHLAGNALAFSPDGGRLIGASIPFNLAPEQAEAYDHHVRVWDTSNWKIQRLLRGHRMRIACVAISSNGELIGSTGLDGTARIWDSEDGRLLHTLQLNGRGSAVAFSPDGRILATGSEDGVIMLWSTATGDSIEKLPAVESQVRSLKFHGTGRALLVQTRAGVLSLGHPYSRVIWQSSAELTITAAALSHDERQVACGTADGRLLFLNSRDGRPIRQIAGIASSITAVAWSLDGARVAYSSMESQLGVVDPSRGTVLLHLSPGRTCDALKFSPNGEELVGTCQRSVLIWEAKLSTQITPPPMYTFRDWEDEVRKSLLGEYYIAGEPVDRATARLQSDPGIPPAIRGHLLFSPLVRSHPLLPPEWSQQRRLNNFAWDIAKSPTRSRAEYKWAIRAARTALITGPDDNADVLNTLGVALYRAGEYGEAYQVLVRADSLHVLDDERSVYDIVFLAMTMERLGRHPEAVELLGRTRELMQDAENRNNQELQSFGEEAEGVIR